MERPMQRKLIALPILILSSVACFAQTFMVVATEIRDGEELLRPFASQEGMIEGMFDLGFVSFDTGPYAPAVDWQSLDFREPLDIARQGLAQFLLTAEVRSVTAPRDPRSLPPDIGESSAPGLLAIETTVRYHLFDVRSSRPLGEGELLLTNDSPDTLELTYAEFLHRVGRQIAGRGAALMERSAGPP
jgi:hypothetical protein